MKDLEKQAQDLRHAEERRLKKIGVMQQALDRSGEQVASQASRTQEGLECNRLKKEAREGRLLADAYREQRDKLQAERGAWDCGRVGEATDDGVSQYGMARSEASFDPAPWPVADTVTVAESVAPLSSVTVRVAV